MLPVFAPLAHSTAHREYISCLWDPSLHSIISAFRVVLVMMGWWFNDIHC